jgi:hypothetical protein
MFKVKNILIFLFFIKINVLKLKKAYLFFLFINFILKVYVFNLVIFTHYAC